MSPMTRGSMPKPGEGAKAAFTALVPDDEAVATRPMFGNLSAFVNGNMFCGLFGDDLFVRLPEAARAEVIAQGGAPFSPMPGRAMQEYVTVPGGWQDDPDAARSLIARSLTWARELPAKQPKSRR